MTCWTALPDTLSRAIRFLRCVRGKTKLLVIVHFQGCSGFPWRSVHPHELSPAAFSQVMHYYLHRRPPAWACGRGPRCCRRAPNGITSVHYRPTTYMYTTSVKRRHCLIQLNSNQIHSFPFTPFSQLTTAIRYRPSPRKPTFFQQFVLST